MGADERARGGNFSNAPEPPETIALPIVFEGDAVMRVRDDLARVLAGGGAARLDASAVAQISTPAVQLLLSAARSFDLADVALTYADPSEPLIDAFSDLGLFAHLAARIDLGGEA